MLSLPNTSRRLAAWGALTLTGALCGAVPVATAQPDAQADVPAGALCEVSVVPACDRGVDGTAAGTELPGPSGASGEAGTTGVRGIRVEGASLAACRAMAQTRARGCPEDHRVVGVRFRYSAGPSVVEGALGAPLQASAARGDEGFPAPWVHAGGLPVERERMGYAPAYLPGPPSPAPDGSMVLRWSRYLQIRSAQGDWRAIDLAQVARQAIEALPQVERFRWDWDQRASYSDQRVAFDRRGVMYTLVQGLNWRAKGAQRWSVGLFVLISADGGGHWAARQIALPDDRARWRARIEVPNGFNDIEGLPSILVYDSDHRAEHRNPSLYLYLEPAGRADDRTNGASERDATGSLVHVSGGSLLQDNHSGAANSTATSAERVYVVFPADRAEPGQPGTPARLAVVDRRTGRIVAEQTVGHGGAASEVDNHNVPGLCLGAGATLQVLLPGHHEDLKFRRGRLGAGPAIVWGPLERIGEPATRAGGYTYGSLDCARDGRTLITSRWAGDQYRFQLVLLQADADGTWRRWARGRGHQVLVDPGRSFYGAWRQKTAVDRSGRFYLYYATHQNQLTDREYLDLQTAFPFEAWERVRFQSPPFCVKGAEPRCWRHPMPDLNPVVLQSDDLATWRFLP